MDGGKERVRLLSGVKYDNHCPGSVPSRQSRRRRDPELGPLRWSFLPQLETGREVEERSSWTVTRPSLWSGNGRIVYFILWSDEERDTY